MPGIESTGQIEARRPARLAALDLVDALARYDPVTGAHLRRLPVYTGLLAAVLATHPRHRFALRASLQWLPQASTLHDVGKLEIPGHILRKRGTLAASEFSVMKRHTTCGGRMLRQFAAAAPEDRLLALGCEIAFYHHERWDGSGYPFGLRGDRIPLGARIVALADVYDALTSARPYKPAFSHDVARRLMLEQAGAHFDPDVIEAFLSCENEFVLCLQGSLQ